MIFASLIFVFGFVPIFLAVYWLTPTTRLKNLWLTLGSYLFYAWWRPDFVLLMLFSTVVDWQCGLRIAADDGPRRGTRWLMVSLVTNLGLLAWFKYANLIVGTVESVGGVGLGWEAIVLPVGISFYTFQSMSYSIDVWRREVEPVRSFADLACFVSMFPQLVAGPIVRYREIAAQLTERRCTLNMVSGGAYLFAIGLVKKTLIADNAARICDPVFELATPGLIEAWVGVAAYSVQILFDFSGYSDMAVGLGMMLGLRMPLNFFAPYLSTSITEFWRRWHISLSAWLRDYLYVPLGGNRRGALRTYFNLTITMLLGGLWHGASWTFVLWGAYQGVFLVVERLAGKRALWSSLPRVLQVFATYVVVLGGWAIFRADGVAGLRAIFNGLAGFNGGGAVPVAATHALWSWVAFVAGLGIAWFGVHSWTLTARFRPVELVLFALLFALALGQLATRSHAPFLYFQF